MAEHPRGLSPASFVIECDDVWPDTLNVTARRRSAGMSFSSLSEDELVELHKVLTNHLVDAGRLSDSARVA